VTALTVLETVDRLRQTVRDARRREPGTRVALVPTMGALHRGHLCLVEHAQRVADLVVVSIFVNPLQFGPGEDLERYPRTMAADLDALEALGVRVVFAPSPQEMYPAGGGGTRVTAGPVASLYEGAARPGHFDGMLTVVNKLFNASECDMAVFGQKDAQQVYLVQQMIRDLNLPVRLEVVPTARENDGLALSSRNRYLAADARRAALVLSQTLGAVASASRHGAAEALAAGRAVMDQEPEVRLDYLVLVDPSTFQPVGGEFRGSATALIAATVGGTRRIDNAPVTI